MKPLRWVYEGDDRYALYELPNNDWLYLSRARVDRTWLVGSSLRGLKGVVADASVDAAQAQRAALEMLARCLRKHRDELEHAAAQVDEKLEAMQ